MPKDVLCEVNECNFWGEGNRCRAEEIYVVVSGQVVNEVNSTEETGCKTFQPKH